MISKEQAKQLLSEGLNNSVADQTEVLLISSNGGLSRFANSFIHQSTNSKDDYLQVRAIVDKKIGIATTNKLENLKTTADKAYQAAKLATQTADFVSLPTEGSIEADSQRYNQKTAEFGPIERADYIEKIIKEAKDYGAAGMFETGEAAMAVANSNGIFSFQKITEANINTIFYSDSESSYSYAVSSDAESIDARKVGQEAYRMAVESKNPVALDPGKYTVILKPAAVADMIGMLAFAGMSALAYQENRSFINGKIGQQIVSDKVTITDDAMSNQSMGWLFDYEGVKKSKVDMIKEGKAIDVVYDSFTANRGKHANTGHALPATSKYGPLPLNLIFKEGTASIDDLIGSTEKGLLINRFHYINLENPIETIFTGMTRDGTFLIENGKIKKAVKNLRFTQSILKALLELEDISAERILASSLTGYYFMPGLKIKSFNFSS